MKVLLATFALACAPVASAGDVQITVHQVEMSHGRMSALLAEELPDAALFTKVRGMVKSKEASLRDTQLIRGNRAGKATLESFRTICYPTAYEPPGLPHSKKYQEKVYRRMGGWGKVFRFFPIIPGAWTGEFESRDVGTRLEIDGEVAEGGPWVQRWFLESTFYLRSNVWGRSGDLAGTNRELRMPSFDYMKMNGGSRAMGGVAFAGVVTPVAADGSLAQDKKILVFVKVDLLK